jgi:hypothetical protein
VEVNLDNKTTTSQDIEIPGYGARAVVVQLNTANQSTIGGTKLEVKTNADQFALNVFQTAPRKLIVSDQNTAMIGELDKVLKSFRPQQLFIVITNKSDQTKSCTLQLQAKVAEAYELWEFGWGSEGQEVAFGKLVRFYKDGGQYAKIQQHYYDGYPVTEPYQVQLDGNKITMRDEQGTSAYYILWEGTFNAERTMITGTQKEIQKEKYVTKGETPKVFIHLFEARMKEPK